MPPTRSLTPLIIIAIVFCHNIMAEPSNSDCNNVQEENNAVAEEEEEVLTINNTNRGIEIDDDDPPTHQVGHEQSKVTAPAVLSSQLETIDDDDGPPPTHHVDDGSEEKRKNTAAAVISSQLEMIDDDDGPPTYHVEDDSHEKRKVTAAAVITSRLEMIEDDDGPPSYQIEDDSHEKRKVTAAAVLSSQLETIEDDDDGPPTYHFNDDADQKRAAIPSFSTIVEPNTPTSIVEDDSIQAKIAAYRIANEEKCEEGYDMSDDESISYEQSTINTMSNHIDEQGIITLNASVQVDENDEEEDIESGIQRESSSSSHSQTQVITGFLVGEEDDDIIIAGVAETILPWWKQRRAKLLITLFFTLLPIVVLLGYTISGERFLWNEYLRGYLVIILCCVSAVVMFAFCYGWNFGNFRLGQWEIVKDLRSSSSDTVESIVREEQRQQKIMLYYICLVLAFLVLGAVGLISIVLSRGYAYPLIFLPCGIALTSALIAILTYTSWKQTSRKMLIFLICISIPILVLVLLIGSLPIGIALSLFFITTLTYTSWKLKHGKILLPVLLILMMAIWGAFLLQSNSFYYGGDIPIVVCTLLLLVVFVSFCCWIVLNHIRSVPSKTAEDIEEKSADSPHSHDGAICTNDEDDNESQSQEEVGASTSTRSSIRRESIVIPEACLVEIGEEDRVAGVAEPMSLRWEQIRGKVIRLSICLICLFFVLGILVAGYFMLANTYPLNQKDIDLPGW